MFSLVQAHINARNTPVARRFEVQMAMYDSFILAIGAIGLTLWFPPLVYAAALGHLIVGFIASISKVFWLSIEIISVVIASILFAIATYSVQVFWHDVPAVGVINFLKSYWYDIVVSAIVLAGIVGNLIAYPGNLDQLREKLDNESSR